MTSRILVTRIPRSIRETFTWVKFDAFATSRCDRERPHLIFANVSPTFCSTLFGTNFIPPVD
jgi:hypothetical protein